MEERALHHMHGKQMSSSLRAHKVFPAYKVLALSAYWEHLQLQSIISSSTWVETDCN